MQITDIDEHGLLRFRKLGGLRATSLIGHKVVVLTRDGIIDGIVGCDPLQDNGTETGILVKTSDLWIDIGTESRDESELHVSVGDFALFKSDFVRLGKYRLIGKALDDRLGCTAPAEICGQLDDNIHWIREAGRNHLVVGSQARILYADCEGRTKIALAFNRAIADGRLSAPVVLGRDHHDVSGTDSPYRETSNIYDGSNRTADMAVQNVIGDSFRGATWVSIHNGGGVGWGEVINGGFGMLIDGSEDSERHIREMLFWDVNNGIARRSWARNEGAMSAIRREMERTPGLQVTMPNLADEELIRKALNE